MDSNDNFRNQPSNPAILPPVPAADLSRPISTPVSKDVLSPPPVAADQAPLLGTEAAVTKARRLVEQHQNDPRQLSQALGQLKAQYLAEEFHVNINPSQ